MYAIKFFQYSALICESSKSMSIDFGATNKFLVNGQIQKYGIVNNQDWMYLIKIAIVLYKIYEFVAFLLGGVFILLTKVGKTHSFIRQ